MNCELCERPTSVDVYLCDGCTQDTAERLQQLPGMFDQLGAMLLPGRTGDGRGTRPTEAPAPADLDMIIARGEFAALVLWHCRLAEARGHQLVLAADPGARVAAAAMALAADLPWIVQNAAAGEFAGAVRDLHAGARSIVGAADLAVRMGLCPTVRDGARCGAVLRLPDRQQVVRCDWCGATYPPGVWAALRREQAKAVTSA